MACFVLSWERSNTFRLSSPSSPPTMPAGVSWATYLKMFAASLLAMCAGAEVVHRYYLPDLVSAGGAVVLAPGPLILLPAMQTILKRN